MNLLRLFFEPKPYPYSEYPVDPNLVWGRIQLLVQDQRGVTAKSVFDSQWDIIPFTEWLIDNQAVFRDEELPEVLQQVDELSIAQKLSHFYASEEDLSDEIYEEVHDYRYHHNLSVGLKGVDMSAVYLGKHRGLVELSMDDEQLSWYYEVDLDRFIEDANLLKSQFTKV